MYAFGTKAEGHEPARRDFTGHELVGATDNPTSRYQSVLDAGARTYIPGLGIFAQVDPLADQMPSYSPYGYGFNDPVSYIDPTGLSPETFGVGRSNGELGATSSDLTHTNPRGWVRERCCPDGGTGDVEDMRQDIRQMANGNVGRMIDAISSAVSSFAAVVHAAFPDQGSPSPEDFHDSGDSQGGGLEMMSGVAMNSNGVVDATDAANGAAGIVEMDPGDVPSGGGSSGADALPTAVKKLDNMASAKSKAESAAKRFGAERPDSMTILREQPDGSYSAEHKQVER